MSDDNMQSSFFEVQPPSKLSNGFPKKLVFLDVETTGGKATYHRIIEIGLLTVVDGEISKVWRSFINPETRIPDNIQRLTGIHPNDLTHAPTFDVIAEELLSYLNDHILVAHNARFDYGFLKNEFKQAGIKYQTKPLCSVKLSRQLFPQYKRHNLDSIIKRFDLPMESRHRAFDDAKAIYDFFLKASSIISEDDILTCCENILSNASLPSHLDSSIVKGLPKQAGVYYFYNKQNKLLYIGKSVNIKTRVMSHFNQDYNNHKDLKMSTQIAHVDYKITPSDFGAQLLESREIKTQFPSYNHRLRKTKNLFQYRFVKNEKGFNTVKIETIQIGEDQDNVGLFRSRRQAIKNLETLADRYQLCHQLLGLESSPSKSSPCFRFQLKKCSGACCGGESADEHNQQLSTAMSEFMIRTWPWENAVLVEEHHANSSSTDEASENMPDYHLIKNWRYLAKLDDPYGVLDYGYQPSVSGMAAKNAANDVSTNILNEHFDLDTYFILARFLLNQTMMKKNRMKVIPLVSITE